MRDCIDVQLIKRVALDALSFGKSQLIKYISSETGVSCISNNDLAIFRVLFIGKIVNMNAIEFK